MENVGLNNSNVRWEVVTACWTLLSRRRRNTAS